VEIFDKKTNLQQTDLNFTYNVTNVGLENITFALKFSNPSLVSTNGKESEAVFKFAFHSFELLWEDD